MKYLYKKLLLILFIFLGLINNISAQFVSFVENTYDTIPCSVNCRTFHTNYLKVNKCNSYSITTIPYTSPNSLSSPQILNLSDDSFSSAVPIGFNFCFFNSVYTNLYISRNGVVTFNSNYASSPCSFNTAQPLPFTSSTFPNEAIFCPFMDLTTSAAGQIKTQTIGTAPFRKFVLQYINLPLFGAACLTKTSNFELVLNESYNTIDVNITKKAVCTANVMDTINLSTLGIQSSNGSFLTALNKNASYWTATNESWEFVPSGFPNFTISYLVNSGSVTQSNNDSVTVCGGTFPLRTIVKYEFNCPSFVLYDTVIMVKKSAHIDSVSTVNNNCKYNNNGIIKIFANTLLPPLQYMVSGYPWSTSNTFSNLPTGLYTASIMDAQGCVADFSCAILSKSKVQIKMDSNKTADCGKANGAIYMSAFNGVPNYTWLWGNGSTNSYILNIKGKVSYHVKVTDALGCVDSMIVETDQKGPVLVLDSMQLASCAAASGIIYLHVKDSTYYPPYHIFWNTGDTTLTLSGCTGNIYYIATITDSLGCTNTYSYLMLLDSLPSVKINVLKKPNCSFYNGVLEAVVSHSTPPYTYLWSNGGTGQTITNADSGFITVTIKDVYGCTASQTIYVNDTLDMIPALNFSNTSCNQNNGSAFVLPYNGMPNYSYLWSTGQTNTSIGNLAPGNYNVVVTDALNCVRTVNFQIGSSPIMNISIVPKNSTCGLNNGTITAYVTGSKGWVQYNWSNGNSVANITGLYAGTYSLTVIDSLGCTANTTVTLTDFGKPYPAIVNYIAPLCAGDSTGLITLLATGGVPPYKYSLDGVNYTTSPTIVNVAAGTYSLYVKDANSCIHDSTITLKDNIPIIIHYQPIDTMICFTDVYNGLTINTTGGFKPYLYNLNNTKYTSSNVFNNLSVGTHQLFLKDSIGCVMKYLIYVPGPDSNLNAIFNTKEIPCFETNTGKITATINGGWQPYTWYWKDSASKDLTRDSLKPGKYFLHIIDSKGCEVDAQELIKKINCCEIVMPNAFTPDIDINNIFKIIPLATLSELNFKIFDRWGGIIFETTDVNEGWNGRKNGGTLPSETYYYTIRYKCSFDENIHYMNGDVILVR